jgi:L-threonylcarbamoyladenylate synthase
MPTGVVQTRMRVADEAAVAEAARCLAAGGLVAFPTETVYGLGADATDGQAVARLYAAKGRPRFNPLISHVADVAAARRLGVFNSAAEQLAEAFWPGPLTLVLPQCAGCSVAALATAGLDSIAVRVPANDTAQSLLRAFGGPVVAPSANLSGHVSPTTAAHVLDDLGGRIDLVLDGGACAVGVESTIVACLGEAPELLRPGGIGREAIEHVLGATLRSTAAPDAAEAPLAPGQLASHYAPHSVLRTDVSEVLPGEALLAFGAVLPPGADKAATALNLSEAGDLAEAAANLFAHLRALDASGASVIAVATIPEEALGAAINDRLRRAAAPRPLRARSDDSI